MGGGGEYELKMSPLAAHTAAAELRLNCRITSRCTVRQADGREKEGLCARV